MQITIDNTHKVWLRPDGTPYDTARITAEILSDVQSWTGSDMLLAWIRDIRESRVSATDEWVTCDEVCAEVCATLWGYWSSKDGALAYLANLLDCGVSDLCDVGYEGPEVSDLLSERRRTPSGYARLHFAFLCLVPDSARRPRLPTDDLLPGQSVALETARQIRDLRKYARHIMQSITHRTAHRANELAGYVSQLNALLHPPPIPVDALMAGIREAKEPTIY